MANVRNNTSCNLQPSLTMNFNQSHHLEEIRVRALNNIISKLEYGLICEDDLIDMDDVFKNLVKWFSFNTIPAKEDVLKLILRLLKNKGDAGPLLLKADPGLSVLKQVTDCDVLVQDIINLTTKQVNSARYASNNEEIIDTSKQDKIHTKAKHFISRPLVDSVSQPIISTKSASTRNASITLTKHKPPKQTLTEIKSVPTISSEKSSFPMAVNTPRSEQEQVLSRRMVFSLPEVPFIASDLHVMSAVEDSLKNLSSIPQSCQFFSSVMLHDFPAEVFLQHAGAIRQVMRLVREPLPAGLAALECLSGFTQLLHHRLDFCSQLEYTSLKSFNCDDMNESWSGGEEGRIEAGSQNSHREVEQEYHREGSFSSSICSPSSRNQGPNAAGEDVLTVPEYCLLAMLAAVPWLGRREHATPLVRHLLALLTDILPDNNFMWKNRSHPDVAPIHNILCDLLDLLVVQITQSVSYDAVIELHVMATSLKIVEALVPVDKASSFLPPKLQDIICFSLMDPILAVNYPQLHNLSLTFANILKCKGTLVYKDVSTVVEAMKAFVSFLEKAATSSPSEVLDLFQDSLPALPFHQDLSIINIFVLYVMERGLSECEVDKAAGLIRALLAHSGRQIAAQAYRTLRAVTTDQLGPCQAASPLSEHCAKLCLLMNSSLLVEIICHGLTNADNEIRESAEEIVVLVVKCQLVVGEKYWSRVIEQLTPVLPLLQCHASKNSPLGRACLHMLDPDLAGSATLSPLQVVSGNGRLLLHRDPLCREEAATRLLWLMGLAHLPYKRLADICLLDVAVTSHTPVTGMYDVGSVVRVLEVLSGPCVEARVRQSALTQLSVMTEDSRLHQVFIDLNGVEVFTNMLNGIMGHIDEEGTSGYIVPIVSTLKHLARHNASVRNTLAKDQVFLINVFKSLFRMSEWRVQRDATQLIAIILYADFILSSPTTLSYPHIVVDSMCLPFDCQTHWTVSPHTIASLKGVVLNHMGGERLLALQWAVLTQGLDTVLQLTDVPLSRGSTLALSLRAVRQVQQSHVVHNCRILLYTFQNATSHEVASQALSSLICYLELAWLVDAESLSSLPWRSTFRRYLLMPPSCDNDFSLLHLVLKFIFFLLGVSREQAEWVADALQTPPHTLLNIIVTTNAAHIGSSNQEIWKQISMWLLQVCKQCVRQGSHSGWKVLVDLILKCLGYSHTQHFYSLALLDCKLECLATMLREPADPNSLWQLMSAFHCESPLSLMGLSITRHMLLCLNKLLALSPDWERSWLSEQNVSWLPTLCESRDQVVRASALQLLSGLARSVRGAATVLLLVDGLFQVVFRIVVDHAEANIVREHAAILLTNIVKNSSSKFPEFVSSAQILCQEFQESLNLVALSPTDLHIDEESGLLLTQPRFIQAGCWLLTNLLASYSDQLLPAIAASSLTTILLRKVVDVERVASCEQAGMVSAACRLLTSCCQACEPTLLLDSLPSITRLLDPDHTAHGCEADCERQTLWRECLELLAAVLNLTKDTQLILPEPTVTTLCQCVQGNDNEALCMSAMRAIPLLIQCLTPAGELSACEALLGQWQCTIAKCRPVLVAALTALVGSSDVATGAALRAGLLNSILTALLQIHLTLTVKTSSTDKLKKNNASLCQLAGLMELACALACGSDDVKRAAAALGLADTVHKVWLWCQVDVKYQLTALELLITFTADCSAAAQTLVLTSNLSGVGQRKSPSSHSLLHMLVTLLVREQHPFSVCSKVLALLTHSCQATECRVIIAKSGLLARWTDQWSNQRKQPAENEQIAWLKFILVFSSFQEGQISIPKVTDLLNQLIQCAESGRPSCRPLALSILRNVAANPTNRPRFLGERSFVAVVGERLLAGGEQEKCDAALIVWSLAANNQKAKVALRGQGLVSMLELAAAACPSHKQLFDFVAQLLNAR